ncbi:hypothetical protein FQN54_007628 [Arachnomyces sp. PD_36]|nr:hypothetical protein FQN54_007628 [Arachnomyces sp. PD_36]
MVGLVVKLRLGPKGLSAVLGGRVVKAACPQGKVLPPHIVEAVVAAVEEKPVPIEDCGPKPAYGDPPAWAETRPELCDAIPWFRSSQGGCYYVKGYCWGLLLDADCGTRSYIDDEVIITRVGGGCEKDEQGNLVLTKDHDEKSPIFRSLLNSMKNSVPIGLVVGNRISGCKTKIPHRYNVMDFFRITDIWYERVGKKTGGKLRLEKIDLGTTSWWAAKDSDAPLPLDQRVFTSPEYPTCNTCGGRSPRVYNESWMCLQRSCSRFFTIRGASPPENLTFYPPFLQQRSSPVNNVRPAFTLVPDLLSTFPSDDRDCGSVRAAWKGIVCPLCKRCIARKFWRGWECETANCGFVHKKAMHPVSLRSIIAEFELGVVGHRPPYIPTGNGNGNEIQPGITYMKNYRKDVFTIEGVGSITHYAANNVVNSRPGGPNDLFAELQVADLGLQRYPLQQSVVAGTLTSHFAVNYGMPYKYVVSVDSRSFADAPPMITRALGRLTWATRDSMEDKTAFQPPNELLTLGYFEDMSIGYHDDGESSLGPTIATLSLGGKATMSIRMKDKYYNGCTAAKKLVADDPILVGCAKFQEKKALEQEFQNGNIDQAGYDRRRGAIVFGVKRRECPAMCVMELNHGDLVVMHGSLLQKYFEHSVVPDQNLRFALTSRYVIPSQVDQSEHWKGDFSLGPDQEYDGDE